MRRTAVLLSIANFLGVVILGGHGGGPVGAYLFALLKGESAAIYSVAVLVPSLLLLLSCLIDRAAAQRILQAIGSGLLLAIWGWLLLTSEYKPLTLVSSVPFLGTTIYALLEAFAFKNTPEPVTPPMRASSILLGVVVLHALASIAQQIARRAQEADLEKALHWGGFSYLLGINGALFVLMALFFFGAWTRRGWALWPGLLVGLYLLATGAWSLVSQVSRESEASLIPLTLFLQGPRLLIVLAAVIALVQSPGCASIDRRARESKIGRI